MKKKRDNNSVELSLSDIFWQLLSQWKKALVFTIAAALLLGGVNFFMIMSRNKNEDYAEMVKMEYDLALKSYELQQKSINSRIENLQTEIEVKDSVKDNSIMLRIDPYNTYSKKVTFYIKTDYMIMPELTYQNPNYTNTVTNSYIDALMSMNLDQAVATESEPELSAHNPNLNGVTSLLTLSEQSGGGLIYITIRGDTKERVDKIFNAVNDMLSERRDMLKDVVSDHDITIISEVDEVGFDSAIRTVQTAFENNYSELMLKIKELSDSLSLMEEPKPINLSTRAAVIGGIKYSIIGGVLGAALSLVIWGLVRCLRGRVNSADELRNRYDAVMLAAIPKASAKRSRLEKSIYRHLGIRKKLNYDSGIELAAANIRLHLPEADSVVLVGTVGEEKLKTICEDLRKSLTEKTVILGGDVNLSAEAVNAVEEGHDIICVEELNESSYQYINHELDVIEKACEQEVYFILIG